MPPLKPLQSTLVIRVFFVTPPAVASKPVPVKVPVCGAERKTSPWLPEIFSTPVPPRLSKRLVAKGTSIIGAARPEAANVRVLPELVPLISDMSLELALLLKSSFPRLTFPSKVIPGTDATGAFAKMATASVPLATVPPVQFAVVCQL